MPFWIWDTTGEFNIWLQSLPGNPRWLLPVTFTGDEVFYLILIPFIYYVVDRRAGITLLSAQLLTYAVNALLKLVFQQPRPFWVTTMKVFVFEDSFGLPSGHAQNAVVVWGYLAFFLIRSRGYRPQPVIVLTALWVFLIGFSRLVLGVHFIQDVLLGWAVGLAVLYCVVRYEDVVRNFLADRTHGGRLFITAVTAILLLEVGALLATTAELPSLEAWTETAHHSLTASSAAETIRIDLHPLKMTAFLNIAGCLFGLYAALSLTDPGYKMPVRLYRRLAILVPGLLLIFTVYLALKTIFPEGGVEGALLRMLRYGLVIFIGLYVYPLILALLRRPVTIQ